MCNGLIFCIMDKSLRRALVALIWAFILISFVFPFIAFIVFMIYSFLMS